MDKFGELSFFRHGFLLGLLVVPAGLVLLQRRNSPRASLSVAAIVSAVIYIWLFAQLQSFQSVGMFVSPGILRDAVVPNHATLVSGVSPARHGIHFQHSRSIRFRRTGIASRLAAPPLQSLDPPAHVAHARLQLGIGVLP